MDLFDQKKENKSLTSIIFDRIREDILNNVYETGDKIVEAKLADELGVSRTPVREALKQLELDGLVENIPNRGVVVKGISKQDILDIYTIRAAIEGIAARWCCDRISDAEIQELKELFELMEFYSFKKDVDKIAELNTRFHEIIYKATRSRYLEHILKDFQIFIKSTRNRSLRTPGRMGEALEEHRAIIEAINAREADAAEKAIMRHLNHSRKNAETV